MENRVERRGARWAGLFQRAAVLTALSEILQIHADSANTWSKPGGNGFDLFDVDNH